MIPQGNGFYKCVSIQAAPPERIVLSVGGDKFQLSPTHAQRLLALLEQAFRELDLNELEQCATTRDITTDAET